MTDPDFSSLFDLLPIGAYRTQPDGRMVRANRALVAMSGYESEAELLSSIAGNATHFYVDPQRRAEFAAELEKNGQVSDFVSEMVRLKNGERIWVREHAHLLSDVNGKPQYFEGTVEDISHEKAATQSLRESEHLLQNVLQTIPDRIWIKDNNGVYLACNQAFAAGFGVDVASVVGTADHHWEDEAMVERILNGDRLAMQAGQSVVTEENMNAPDNFVESYYEIVKTPLRDAQGRTMGLVGIARDIQRRKTAEMLLRDTSEQLELAIMGADLGRWDHDLTIEKGYYLDERSCAMLGRPASDSNIGRAWGHLIHPDDLQGTLDAMRVHLTGAAPAYEAEYRARHFSGDWVWISNRGKVVQFSKDGKPLRMVGTLMDVSKRKLVENQLLATRAELQATLNALPDLVFEFSGEGHYRAVHSHRPEELLLPIERQIGRKLIDVLPRESAEICMSALQEALASGRAISQHYSLELPNGKHWFELSVVRKPMPLGEEDRLIAIARNVTQSKLNEQAIAHLAFHDALTGLPNRRLLADRLESAISASQRGHTHGGLLFIDLDKFKELNDVYGHDVGDLLLQEVARRLQQCIRGIDTAARLGGDEFVVLIQTLSTDTLDAELHAAAVGHKILSSLNEPYVLMDQSHVITPSIGVTLFLGRDASPAEILKQADTAMYHAKAQGRNTLCFYQDSHN